MNKEEKQALQRVSAVANGAVVQNLYGTKHNGRPLSNAQCLALFRNDLKLLVAKLQG